MPDDYTRVDNVCGPPDLLHGQEGMRELFKHLRTVQYQQWTINDVIAEGNKLVTPATNTCVPEDFFGVPGSGKQQVFRALFMHYIVDGKIAETWRNADDPGRVFRLGEQVVPGNAV